MRTYALTYTAPDRIDLFVPTSNNAIAHYYYHSLADQRWHGTANNLGVPGGQGSVFSTSFTALSSMQEIINIGPNPGNPLGHAVAPLEKKQADSPPGASLIGSPIPKQPCIDLFAIGGDYSMYTLRLINDDTATTATQPWTNLGGGFISSPATVAWNGRIDLFGIGNDRAMYQKTYVNSWSPSWLRIGGVFTSEACAVSWGPGRLDVFARGSDFSLRHRATADGTTWSTDWENLGGSLATAPVALSWGVNRLDVFAVGNDGSLIHRWWDGQIWNDWENLGFPAQQLTYVDTPAAVSWGPNRIDVFNLGSDGSTYHLWLDQGSWQGPEMLVNDTAATPAVIAPGPNQLFVVKPHSLFEYGTSYDQNGYHTYYNIYNSSWKGWSNMFTNYTLINRYKFDIIDYLARTIRSHVNDTDTVASILQAGNWPAKTAWVALGDVGKTSKTGGPINIVFDRVPVELCEEVIFNYQILNTESPNAATALLTAGTQLAAQTVGFIEQAFNAGIIAIVTIAIGPVAKVPVLGSILGVLESWLLQQLNTIVFANCDGLVAVEQVVIQGRDMRQKTIAGQWETTTVHKGTDSNAGCGANSDYEVSWSISVSQPPQRPS